MKRLLVAFAVVALLVGMVAVPAAGGNGRGELMASFNAGLSGGAAIDVNGGEAVFVASPQAPANGPEGRIRPFGNLPPLFEPLEVCDQLLVGTWVIFLEPEKPLLDLFEQELKLDGVLLETTRTAYKRITQGDFQGGWWFSEGVPVLGYLDPGAHVIEWSLYRDGFPLVENLLTHIDVDASYCS